MGFLLSKTGLFPPAGSRAASQIILNVTLPSLLFAKIIPSFNSDNVKAIGPIFLVDCVYMALCGLFAIALRAFVPTPRNFRWGLIAAGIWSNAGDLPTSVVLTVCSSAPFKGQADADLAVAYVALLILLFYVTLFPLRGTLLIERDYTHPPKDVPDDEEAAAVTRSTALARLTNVARKAGAGMRRRRGRDDTSDTRPEDKEGEGGTATSKMEGTGFVPLRSVYARS